MWLVVKKPSLKEIVASIVLLVFTASITFLSFGTEKFNFMKVAGLSMSDTIDQPISVPFVRKELRHRGAFLKISQSIEPSVGSIVLFTAEDGGRDVKRVSKIREDGALWVTADNVGWTGCDSREYGWIRQDRIVGTGVDIITPRRLIRSLTKNGRWWNDLQMAYPPTLMRKVGRYVVVDNYNDGQTYLCHPNLEEAIRLGQSNLCAQRALEVDEGRLAIPLANSVALVDLKSLEVRPIPIKGTVSMAHWMDQNTLCVRMTMGQSDPGAFINVPTERLAVVSAN